MLDYQPCARFGKKKHELKVPEIDIAIVGLDIAQTQSWLIMRLLGVKGYLLSWQFVAALWKLDR